MKHLIQLLIVWVGDYFYWVPQLFGLKVLLIERYDITPWVDQSITKGPMSKVSWLVKNISTAPLTLKIVIECTLDRDADLQIYPIIENGTYQFAPHICSRKETFDPDTKKKSKNMTAPPQQLIKIDYFASQEPHPSLSGSPLELIPDDPNVIIRDTNLIETPSGRKWKWIVRTIILALSLAMTLLFLLHLIANYTRSVLSYWNSLAAQ